MLPPLTCSIAQSSEGIGRNMLFIHLLNAKMKWRQSVWRVKMRICQLPVQARPAHVNQLCLECSTLTSPQDAVSSPLCQNNDLHLAIQKLEIMHRIGTPLSQDNFQPLLKMSCNTENLNAARRLQSLIVSCFDILFNDNMLPVFSSLGCMLEANIAFCMVTRLKWCSWHALISLHAKTGLDVMAFQLYYSMLDQGIKPTKPIYMCLLKCCACAETLEHGKLMHSLLCMIGIEFDDYIRSALVLMYLKCGNLDEGCKVFESSPNQTVSLWTSMISGYIHHHDGTSALKLFESMMSNHVTPNNVTILCVLTACGSVRALDQGHWLHDWVVKEKLEYELPLMNALIGMYCKCGKLEEAQRLFNTFVNKTIVSWGTMIAGCVDLDNSRLALSLLDVMRNKNILANHPIYVSSLKACGQIQDLKRGHLLHSEIYKRGLEPNVIVGSTLVDMYVRCYCLPEACYVFKGLYERNAVSWAAIIGGCAELENSQLALDLFGTMQQEGILADRVIFLCVLKACTSTCLIRHGRVLHSLLIENGYENDIMINNAVMNMYSKCFMLRDAHKVFNVLPIKTAASWSTLVAGFTDVGDFLQSLKIYQEMEQKNIPLDTFTLSSVLKACGNAGILKHGQRVHVKIVQTGFDSDRVVKNSLIDMYSRCGSPEDARCVLKLPPKPDITSWGALINGYCHHGNLIPARQCIQELKDQGLHPDDVILTTLLNACTVSKSENLQIFKSMEVDHGIFLSIEHLSATTYFLGSIGYIEEAKRFLQTIPNVPNNSGWVSLLTACRLHGDVGTGKQSHVMTSQLCPGMSNRCDFHSHP